MSQKPSIPKGTRDFSPLEMARRNIIFSTLKNIFQLYGYLPIETPAMENLSTLLGKYGEEGDKLLFKILNSGDFLKKIRNSDIDLKNVDANKLSLEVSEKGLIYDLTVPFARYVVQHRNELTFPFKRYQIQPVWRADNPQKSRYREFSQCDADVIGSNSLLNEAELLKIIDDVFLKLELDVIIKINNRKILSGIAEKIGEADKIIDITVAIDKLDKIGLDGVNEELSSKGINKKAIAELQPIINLRGTPKEKIEIIKKLLKDSEIGLKGIEEIEDIFEFVNKMNIKSFVDFDLTLARGLNYYTGVIIEVLSKDVKIGSICGGGRYDDLTGIFGLPDVSGVGISFGADRIYDVLNELKLFPDTAEISSQIMFVNFGKEEEDFCLPFLEKLRNAGIKSEIYPSSAKMKKQMTYANNKNIPYVAIVGSQEIETKKITLKNMTTGEQKKLDFDELIKEIK